MQTTQPTTREAISQQDSLKTGIKQNFETEFSSEIQHLNELVRHSLGNLTPSSDAAAALVGEACQQDDSCQPAFRLVSRTLPPRPIFLAPAYHISVPHQRPVEDTPHEAAVRRSQAEEAAVDLDWIYRVAHTKSTISRHQDGGRNMSSEHDVRELTVSGSDLKKFSASLPNLLLTEGVKPQVTSSRAGGENRWKAKVKCCKVLSISTDSDSLQKKKRRNRSHHSHAPKIRQPPRFFRPMQEWGGKSAGYAMGWRGSWPTHKSDNSRYFRDKMRTGILVGME